MATPFIGEVRMFAGPRAPANWALCDGSLLPISEYQVLYTLIGTTYGGDGVSTFGLPDMRGRVPMHVSRTYALGALGGTETVSLVAPQLPAHTHSVQCNGAPGNMGGPKGNFFAGCTLNPTNQQPVDHLYFSGTMPSGQMAAGVVIPNGGGAPHDNVQPFQVINYIIALEGIFPSSG
jgi:microcystin-dependent protein